MDKNELNHQKWLNWSKKGYVDIMYWIIFVVIVSVIIAFSLILFGEKKLKIAELIPIMIPLAAVIFFVLPMVSKYRKKNIDKENMNE